MHVKVVATEAITSSSPIHAYHTNTREMFVVIIFVTIYNITEPKTK
jgi:hypothetical protein